MLNIIDLLRLQLYIQQFVSGFEFLCLTVSNGADFLEDHP